MDTRSRSERFGQKIRDARLRLGLEQSEVSRLTGLSPTTPSKIESGAMPISRESTIKALAKALELDPTELLLISGHFPRGYGDRLCDWILQSAAEVGLSPKEFLDKLLSNRIRIRRIENDGSRETSENS